MFNFGVIGFGYWGPNVVRNVMAIKGADVTLICDRNPEALKKVKDIYPHMNTTAEVEDVLKSKDIHKAREAANMVLQMDPNNKDAKKVLDGCKV